MVFVFYIFAAILVVLSFKSFRGGIRYLRFFRSELAKPVSGFVPFTSVIVPCRGVDQDLRENLLAIALQDYPDYEIIFVVDDRRDKAVEIIEEISTSGTRQTCLVVADKATGSSQKVENLREGVLRASRDSSIFVFADSDARPSPRWLRDLVAPLENELMGAATGYRWFMANTPTFASEIRSVWNASIATALGPNTRSNFCWGGSMAIRRNTFDRLEVCDKWRGTLSDDFTVTRTMSEAGLGIAFVPQALTASVEDCTLGEMLEFTTRQMKITRVYSPKLWLVSLIGSGLFTGVMATAMIIVILGRIDDIPVLASYLTLLLVTIFSIGKAWLRLIAVRLVLPQYESALKGQFWTQNTLWLLAPPLFLYNCVSAWASRRMTWRGTTYELKSPTETVIIAD